MFVFVSTQQCVMYSKKNRGWRWVSAGGVLVSRSAKQAATTRDGRSHDPWTRRATESHRTGQQKWKQHYLYTRIVMYTCAGLHSYIVSSRRRFSTHVQRAHALDGAKESVLLLQVIAPAAGSLVRFVCSRRSAGTDLRPNKRLIDYKYFRSFPSYYDAAPRPSGKLYPDAGITSLPPPFWGRIFQKTRLRGWEVSRGWTVFANFRWRRWRRVKPQTLLVYTMFKYVNEYDVIKYKFSGTHQAVYCRTIIELDNILYTGTYWEYKNDFYGGPMRRPDKICTPTLLHIVLYLNTHLNL